MVAYRVGGGGGEERKLPGDTWDIKTLTMNKETQTQTPAQTYDKESLLVL